MKYECYPQDAYTAVVELVPTTEADRILLKSMKRDNEDHLFTLHHHFEQGVKKIEAKAQLADSVDYVVFPTRAICRFEMVRGIGF